MWRLTLLGALLAVAVTQSACVVVGGYSSRGGWFIWPSGLGLVVILMLLYLIFGRRR
jgi:hypothetical protein